MLNDTTMPAYHGDGPALPGESVHQALGENTAMSLGGHLLNQPTPGHGFEDEPLDSAEKAGQQTAQAAYSFANAGQNGSAPRPGM